MVAALGSAASDALARAREAVAGCENGISRRGENTSHRVDMCTWIHVLVCVYFTYVQNVSYRQHWKIQLLLNSAFGMHPLLD